MKKFVALSVVCILMVVGVVYVSPYWALYQLKNAYDAKDASTINHYINFPTLQTSIKQQLNTVLLAKAQKVTNSPILQALNIDINADQIISKMVNQAVDNTVTEVGVTNLLNGQTTVASLDNNAKLLGGLTAVALDKIDIQDLITAHNQDELTQKVKQQLSSPNPNTTPVKDSATYCGFNCFNIQTQVKGYPITVNMQRQGWVHWQIVGVKLPFNS